MKVSLTNSTTRSKIQLLLSISAIVTYQQSAHAMARAATIRLAATSGLVTRGVRVKAISNTLGQHVAAHVEKTNGASATRLTSSLPTRVSGKWLDFGVKDQQKKGYVIASMGKTSGPNIRQPFARVNQQGLHTLAFSCLAAGTGTVIALCKDCNVNDLTIDKFLREPYDTIKACKKDENVCISVIKLILIEQDFNKNETIWFLGQLEKDQDLAIAFAKVLTNNMALLMQLIKKMGSFELTKNESLEDIIITLTKSSEKLVDKLTETECLKELLFSVNKTQFLYKFVECSPKIANKISEAITNNEDFLKNLVEKSTFSDTKEKILFTLTKNSKKLRNRLEKKYIKELLLSYNGKNFVYNLALNFPEIAEKIAEAKKEIALERNIQTNQYFKPVSSGIEEEIRLILKKLGVNHKVVWIESIYDDVERENAVVHCLNEQKDLWEMVIDEDWFTTLSSQEKLYVIGHEAMHVKLKHSPSNYTNPKECEKQADYQACNLLECCDGARSLLQKKALLHKDIESSTHPRPSERIAHIDNEILKQKQRCNRYKAFFDLIKIATISIPIIVGQFK